MSSSDGFMMGMRTRQNGVNVDFAQIFASAQQSLQLNPQSFPDHHQYEPTQPRRLADMHTARAAKNTQTASTFESQQASNALRRMSTFINDNMSTIRRLSRLPAEYDFTQLMATYGKHPEMQNTGSIARSHTNTPSSAASSTSRGFHTRAVTNASPLPAPHPLRTRTQTLQHAQAPNMDQQLSSRSYTPPVYSHNASARAVSPADTINAAVAHLNRRQPSRSATPLPSSPRASLALRAAGSMSRRKMSEDRPAPLPPLPAPPASVASGGGPSIAAGLRALKLGASVSGDERMFQQVQARG